MENPSPLQIKTNKMVHQHPFTSDTTHMAETKELTVLLHKVEISSLILILGTKLQNISK